MSVLYAILLGVLQGITEFLPISSFGHINIAEEVLGIKTGSGVLFETLLHMGTLVAVFYVFQKDIRRMGMELLDMIMDIIGNINLYIHNRRTGDNLHYAKVVTGAYRKFTALVAVSSIPTFLLGYAARNLVSMAAESPVAPGIFLLLTGVFLIVVDFSRCKGKRPQEKPVMNMLCGLVLYRDFQFSLVFPDVVLRLEWVFFADSAANLRLNIPSS